PRGRFMSHTIDNESQLGTVGRPAVTDLRSSRTRRRLSPDATTSLTKTIDFVPLSASTKKSLIRSFRELCAPPPRQAKGMQEQPDRTASWLAMIAPQQSVPSSVVSAAAQAESVSCLESHSSIPRRTSERSVRSFSNGPIETHESETSSSHVLNRP